MPMGAEWDGMPVGSHGNAVAFSFHATKNITTIEGGAIAVPDAVAGGAGGPAALPGAQPVGVDPPRQPHPRPDYELDEPGFKLAMTDVAAAIGVHQLARLDGILDRREELAQRYDAALDDLPLELEPPADAGMRHGRHLYAVRVSPEAPVDRDELIDHLAESPDRHEHPLQADPPLPLLPRDARARRRRLPGRLAATLTALCRCRFTRE